MWILCHEKKLPLFIVNPFSFMFTFITFFHTVFVKLRARRTVLHVLLISLFQKSFILSLIFLSSVISPYLSCMWIFSFSLNCSIIFLYLFLSVIVSLFIFGICCKSTSLSQLNVAFLFLRYSHISFINLLFSIHNKCP